MKIKNLLIVTAIFTLSAMFFTGCGKLFMSDKEIKEKFENHLRSKEVDQVLQKEFFKIHDVSIKEADGDNYKLSVTFIVCDKQVITKATGFFDGKDISVKFTDNEWAELYSPIVTREVRKKAEDISYISTRHTGNNLYKCMVKYSNGKYIFLDVKFDRETGKIKIIRSI